jgi:hypothetical protein
MFKQNGNFLVGRFLQEMSDDQTFCRKCPIFGLSYCHFGRDDQFSRFAKCPSKNFLAGRFAILVTVTSCCF